MTTAEKYLLPQFEAEVKKAQVALENTISEATKKFNDLLPKMEEKWADFGGRGLYISPFFTEKNGMILAAFHEECKGDPVSMLGNWSYEEDLSSGIKKIIPDEKVGEELARAANVMLELGFKLKGGLSSSNGKEKRGTGNLCYKLFL